MFRETIHSAVLMRLNEQFTPAVSQFGFQEGISISQALLQVNDNTKQVLVHSAILGLEKASDKVDRGLLLDLIGQCMDDETTAMIRALLGPLCIRAKSDPTNYTA